uniref:DUF1109 domain-containing protein n=1 Tax=Pseudomonas sp. K-62 TaxID=76885 RepID=I2FG47_9PSED|nr:DUF1109 domain-containing protein [Pseudomonas sp. K-62]BAM13982.1 hypothetical protein [Pseudomonas sp. K-62]
MRTDELIHMLSTDLEPVDRRRVSRSLGAAVAVGMAVAVAAISSGLGVRPDINQAEPLRCLLLKLLFTGSIVAITFVLLVRLARPGGERRTPFAVACLPLVALLLLGTLYLAAAPSSSWDRMIVGHGWLMSLISIPVIAIVPFSLIVWALRKGAPTDLKRAGALAGLIAGGVGATAYALHCTDDSLPFVALWYSFTVVLCAFLGAKLGPRLLRW